MADFEEYTRLYWDSWKDPTIRWLLSAVPSAMIFDDHDVHDDWNTSEAWVRKMRTLGALGFIGLRTRDLKKFSATLSHRAKSWVGLVIVCGAPNRRMREYARRARSP